MKIECELEKIKNAILQVERVTGKNLTLPVLSSVLLIASGKSLKLRATNLNLGIEVEINAKVEKEGIVAVSGSVLLNIFSNFLKNENISLEEDGGNLLIKTNKSRIKVKCQNHDDFPTIPIVSGIEMEIESNKFIEGVKAVYYSSSTSDIKPEISSVFMYTNEDNLFFVSTDSFRLAEKKIKIKNIEEISGIIIPHKNIIEILKILSDFDGLVKISFNKNQISFSFKQTYLTSRVIDGVFPDYKQIIPKEFKTEAILLKQDLINALKLSNIFSDKFSQVNLKINKKEKLFEISSFSGDVGENKTQIDASLEGEDVELSFNYKYFLDCLSSINTDSVFVRLNQSSKPIIVSGVSDNSFIYLIMPMNK